MLIFVKFDVEDFPLANADAGMTALMSLVTVMATEVLHRTSRVDFDFINGKNTETLSIETFVCLLACISTCFGETIFA